MRRFMAAAGVMFLTVISGPAMGAQWRDSSSQREAKPIHLTASQVQKVVGVLQDKEQSLTDAVDKAKGECNGTPILADAQVLSQAEYNRKLNKTEHGAGDRAGLEQKVLFEVTCAPADRQGSLELVAVCLESDEANLIKGTQRFGMQDQQFQTDPMARNVAFEDQEYQRAPYGEQDRRRSDYSDPDRDQDDWDAWDRGDQRQDRRFWNRERDTRENRNIRKGSEIIGANVLSFNDEDLGEIEDLALDPQTGKIKYVVLAAGGFLGIGDKYFAVPWTALQRRDESTFVVNIDKQTLENMQGFNEDNWPDAPNRQFVGRMRSRPFDDDRMGRYDRMDRSDRERRGFMTETRSRSQTFKMEPSQAVFFARALQDNDFELKEAIETGEKHTGGKAILARCTFTTTGRQRQLTGFQEGTNQDQDDQFDAEHGQHSQRQWQDDEFQGRQQSGHQVMVEVTCADSNDPSKLTIVTISPNDGEVVNSRDVNVSGTRRTRSPSDF